MTVTRLSDGVVLGSALTDDKEGLVTIRPRASDGPVLLTLQGRAGALYYDEGKKSYQPFDETRVLHALVDQFEENVGVTAFTEAAYRYAINHFVANPESVKSGVTPLLSSANKLRLTLGQVSEANRVVLEAINNALPSAYRLTSLKSLPTPTDDRSGNASAPNNNYGVSAVLTGGLAIASDIFAFDPQSPALEVTEELARDLTDGKVNGFSLDGTPASLRATAATQTGPHYDPNRFGVGLTVAANEHARQISEQAIFPDAFEIAEVGITTEWSDQFLTRAFLSTVGLCLLRLDTVTLRKDGAVNVIRGETSDCGRTSRQTSLPNFVLNARQVFSSGFVGFITLRNGDVQAWGKSVCGSLGNGQASSNLQTPQTLTTIRDITSLGTGWSTTIARTTDGRVFSWGADVNGALGLGDAPKQNTCTGKDLEMTLEQVRTFVPEAKEVSDFQIAANYTPTPIPSLSNIVSISTSSTLATFYAIRDNGMVYGWGSGNYGLLANGLDNTNLQLDRNAPITIPIPKSIQSVVTTGQTALALDNDGTIFGWGANGDGGFGDGTTTPRPAPVQVPDLRDVKQLYGTFFFALALQHNGDVLRWGMVPQADGGQLVIQRPTKVPGLPKIRHISEASIPLGLVLLIAEDDSVFLLSPFNVSAQNYSLAFLLGQ